MVKLQHHQRLQWRIQSQRERFQLEVIIKQLKWETTQLIQQLRVANMLMLKYHMMRNEWNYDSIIVKNQETKRIVLF